jgi:hypothetical protein
MWFRRIEGVEDGKGLTEHRRLLQSESTHYEDMREFLLQKARSGKGEKVEDQPADFQRVRLLAKKGEIITTLATELWQYRMSPSQYTTRPSSSPSSYGNPTSFILAPDSQGNPIPLDAKWTKISRTLVSPEVLDQDKRRYEAYVLFSL